jgi:PAS domain S-box-containing protein
MRLNEIFGRSRDVVIAMDAAGQVTYRNPAAEALPADQREACETGMRAAKPSFEWSAGRSWFSAEVTALAEGTLCVSRDITALKRSEERLRRSERMLVDAQGVAHMGTWEWDITQPTATWSAELYRIYGLTPETYTPSYEAYLTMVHEDDRQRVIDATNRVFHEQVPYSHDERIFRPDRTMRYLHTWAFPLVDDAGKLTHLIGVCQDITDRALADEALHRANAELEKRVLERTLDLEAFNSMVAHDLRAPLAVIQLCVDLLAKKSDGSDAAKYLDRIRRAIGNMGRLMDDLLAFAKLGQGALQLQELDVSELCAEIIADLRGGQTPREATVTIAPGMRCTADPALFRVVLTNLIGNAWKYTERREATTIEIGIAGGALSIRDNGIGFDMADCALLFLPFERLANAKEFAGTGIGLATVQRIVERHGGTISATAAPDQGATFSVTLPGLGG